MKVQRLPHTLSPEGQNTNSLATAHVNRSTKGNRKRLNISHTVRMPRRVTPGGSCWSFSLGGNVSCQLHGLWSGLHRPPNHISSNTSHFQSCREQQQQQRRGSEPLAGAGGWRPLLPSVPRMFQISSLTQKVDQDGFQDKSDI